MCIVCRMLQWPRHATSAAAAVNANNDDDDDDGTRHEIENACHLQ